MRQRSMIIVAVVVLLAVTGATVGLLQTRAQGEPALPSVTPAELLAGVVQHAGDVAAVSGQLSWNNDLFGLSLLSFGGQGTGDFTALFSTGRGRLWAKDGKIRFDIRGMVGDTSIIGDSAGVWVYTYSANTATRYDFSGEVGAGESTSHTVVADLLAAIEGLLEKLAPDATLSIDDQISVAGRPCYVLALVPKAVNTVLASVQVAIDGTTYLPLKLDIYAKGTEDPLLTAGFDSISYSEVDDNIFAFTPPAGAAVVRKTIDFPLFSVPGPPGDSADGPGDEPAGARGRQLSTLSEVAQKTGFKPLAAHTDDPALAFAGAYVMPAEEIDLGSLLGRLGPPRSLPTPPPNPATVGPTIVQHYGHGFGRVVLVQTRVPAEFAGFTEQALARVPLVGRTEIDRATVYRLDTALGSVALWQREGMMLVAVGLVSAVDLKEFIAGVR